MSKLSAMPPPTAAPPFTERLDVAVRSHAGIEGVAIENQDNYLLIDGTGRARYLRGGDEQQTHISGWPAGHARVAVLDGMGGHGFGREAAEAAVTGLLELPPCTTAAHLARGLERLHAHLQQQFASAAGPRPGTTLTLIEIPPQGPALLFHVGDSRLYELNGGTIAPLTVDHVPATAFALQGILGEHEWWAQVHGEHRPQISQAFILGDAMSDPSVLADPLFELSAATLPPFLADLPDRRPLELRPGKTYILATDGFWACAEANRWVAQWPRILGPSVGAQAKVDALFRAMNEHPPPHLHADNLTAIVLCPAASPAADSTAVPYQ